MTEAPQHSGKPFDGLPEYSAGKYHNLHPDRHSEDARFKSEQFLSVFCPTARERGWKIERYADVGCGSGNAVHAIVADLRAHGHPVSEAWGFDVFPEVEGIESDAGVRFVCGDFTRSGERMDLVTLFDVFEHVPDPIGFLRAVGERCDYVSLHIPLDNTFNHSVRDRYASKLSDPGHMIFLDTPQALSLLSYSGLRVIRYAYTPGFRTPSGTRSLLARLARVPRELVYSVSPWLVSKLLGGCSLMVIAETRTGWSKGL